MKWSAAAGQGTSTPAPQAQKQWQVWLMPRVQHVPVALAILMACVAIFFCLKPLLAPPPQPNFVNLYADDETAISESVYRVFRQPVYVVAEQPGSILRVTFVNSPYSELVYADQREVAETVARYVVDGFGGNRIIRGVIVQFAQQNTFLGLTVGPPSMVTHSFMRGQLR